MFNFFCLSRIFSLLGRHKSNLTTTLCQDDGSFNSPQLALYCRRLSRVFILWFEGAHLVVDIKNKRGQSQFGLFCNLIPPRLLSRHIWSFNQRP